MYKNIYREIDIYLFICLFIYLFICTHTHTLYMRYFLQPCLTLTQQRIDKGPDGAIVAIDIAGVAELLREIFEEVLEKMMNSWDFLVQKPRKMLGVSGAKTSKNDEQLGFFLMM